jgi:short-subunit dehydrogenase
MLYPPSQNKQSTWHDRYGPWAIVTGASDGIGREMALCLARSGIHLVLVARRRALLDQLASELNSHHHVQTLVIDGDLGQLKVVEEVLKATQSLDIGLLVACAGFGTTGPLVDADSEQELNMLAVNCQAVLLLTQRIGRRLVQRGRGGIILMSSLVAFQGVPLAAHYAATKAWVQVLAEGLHEELAPLGVDVLASSPGPVHSGFAARANQRMGLAASPAVVAQKTLVALGRKTTVRPGHLSKLLIGSLALLPRDARVQAMKRIMHGMTRHQALKKGEA